MSTIEKFQEISRDELNKVILLTQDIAKGQTPDIQAQVRTWGAEILAEFEQLIKDADKITIGHVRGIQCGKLELLQALLNHPDLSIDELRKSFEALIQGFEKQLESHHSRMQKLELDIAQGKY